MVTMTRIEINFQRLLSRCEAMASEITRTDKGIDWRLEKVNNTRLTSISVEESIFVVLIHMIKIPH